MVEILPAFSVTFLAEASVLPQSPPTFALRIMSLPAPVAVRPTVPEPPAVTAAPMVSVPVVAVRLMLPLAAVVIAPLVVSAPVLPP